MESPRTKNNSLTPSQQNAVAVRGNVLVMAGAGTGKTKTLVERCLDCLERDSAAINELLIVTFTEAAAAEMRQRLRHALEAKAQDAALNSQPSTLNFWQEQLARFDLAHIGTLHSFCRKLVREHFYELGLDPQLALLDEGEARQRAHEVLAEQFHSHYEGAGEISLAVQNLVQVHGGGRDEDIRALILQLHHYSQTRPDAAGWLAEQTEKFSRPEPGDWQNWLLAALASWRDEWLPVLETFKTENVKAAELAGILSRLSKSFSRAQAADVLEQIVSADGNWPLKKKTVLRKPLEDFFDEAAFLVALAPIKNGTDPLAEDWSWVRGQMETLLRLAQEFATRFAEAKRRDSVMDFHDLEQFALQLLWNFSTGEPTAVAAAWRAKLKFIFVDEYQDINAAQDKIIAALAHNASPSPSIPLPSEGRGKPEATGNRFLVGDVKQSIYRFRLADPKIFRGYARDWKTSGKIIPLSENFRSREGLLNFVNSVCGLIMREEIGGVAYDAEATLKFGSPQTRSELSVANDSAPRVELLLRLKPGRNVARDEAEGEFADLAEAQKEARLVAQHLKDCVAGKTQIWDEHGKSFRAAEWRDVAILLRSPRGKSEVFAKEFERAGIPLAVAPGNFFEGAEILDLISLLQLLDNPLQDVPCIAVLRSPFVGLSLDELAEIRLAAREKHFWTALVRIQNSEARIQKLVAKVSKFLEKFSRWRKLVKQISLSQCLEEILAETFYADWLRAQPRGPQRAANVAGFLLLTQKFDQFQRQGLRHFLKFIENQQAMAVEPEVPATVAENAVRLMSIHQSKGLEFPVVVLADLAKKFNEQDLRAEIIFDEELGLCPKVKPPASGRRYPSLPHWLAQRRQQRELRGEELRLLYVALTRARDNLILTASITEKNWEEKWTQPQPVTTQKIADANSFADWLRMWFALNSKKEELLRWRLADDAELANADKAEIGNLKLETEPAGLDMVAMEKLKIVLDRPYPQLNTTRHKAKSSVTELRRAAAELDDEAEPMFPDAGPPPPARTQNFKSKISNLKPDDSKLSATEIGSAHHTFLQHVALGKTGDWAAEINRLVQENYLSAAEAAALDLDALAAFWNSTLGEKLISHRAAVRRELPFTARFSPAEISKIIGCKIPPAEMKNEFVVVQGVADLVVLLPAEIWLVDFKTDAVNADGLAEKIRTYTPQLKLYAAALKKIFKRPVTLRALHFLAAGRTEII